MSDPPHVTFRPGELLARLSGGPLSPGSTAKRDLTRYYYLIDGQFTDWWKRTEMTVEGWKIMVIFASTREWDYIPDQRNFAMFLQSFLRSRMAKNIAPEVRQKLIEALLFTTSIDVIAIIDRVEFGELTSLDVPTGDATSAA